VGTDGFGWCFFVVTGVVVEGVSVAGGLVVGGVLTVITGGLVVGVVVVVVVVVTTGRGGVMPCVLSGAVLMVPASTGSELRGTLVGLGTLVDGAGAWTIGAGEPFGAVVVVEDGAGSGIVVKLVALWLDGPGVPPW
jgi:hypothetical protein